MTAAIIAGGRSYILGRRHFAWLDIMRAQHGFTRVVVGCAPGADTGGELWAKRRGLPVDRYAADWSLGRSAGPARNARMADYAAGLNGVCLLFPGGIGTASMEREARRRDVPVIHFQPGPVKRKVIHEQRTT